MLIVVFKLTYISFNLFEYKNKNKHVQIYFLNLDIIELHGTRFTNNNNNNKIFSKFPRGYILLQSKANAREIIVFQ